MKNLMKNTPAVKKPIWQRFTAYLMSFILLGQICLPATVVAVELISDVYISSEVNSNAQFERVYNTDRQFEKAFYVEDITSSGTQTVESFHQKLLDFRKSSLPAPLMIPIMNGEITIIFPHYRLEKRIGDQFVQARFIRSQIFNLLNRNLLSDAYANEAAQINGLYNKAYEFSAKSSAKFGDSLTRAQVNTFGHNFIWPELRTVNGEAVLVPIVHLTDASVDELLVDGHIVEFAGETAQFNTITVNAGTIYTRRGTFLNTAGDFTVSEGASVVADGDLNLLVGGTLQNLSGRLSAEDNVNIIANQYLQKTVVHRYATRYEQGTRLGEIASVDAVNGNVSIRSYNDIVVQGGTISGNNVILNADGNIQLTTQYTTYVRNQAVGGYDETQSIIEHTASVLSAKDNIYLMASGAIELNAATLFADEGVIQILAEQGVYIANEFNEFQSSRSGKVGKVTLQEQEFQTIAIRSALEAGKGVLIASNFGDITLQATEIISGAGTQINALNGKVNLLLAKEQDHYFYNRVKEGFWRIKTETQTDTVDTAVYNSIIGGIKVQATHGVTLEFGQEEGVTLQDSLAMFEQTEDLAWMAEAYNDPELASNIELVYQELVKIHEYDKSSSLSPAAMAIIAIAVAVAMGPAGVGLIGAKGAIGAVGFVAQPVMQAGALALATQTAMSFANGNNLSETVKLMHSSDTIRAVATAMITAGALSAIDEVKLFDMPAGVDASADLISAQTAIDLGNQATLIVVETTVSTGISTIINGGDLGDFGEALVQGLQLSAINKIGQKVANEIGGLADSKPPKINEALRYISHAGLGCALGAATAEVSGSSDPVVGCGSGAGGAVIGEAVAQAYTEAMMTDNQKEVVDWLKSKGIMAEGDFEALTPAQQAEYYTLVQSMQVTPSELLSLQAKGVDLAKLAGGLAAFAAGAEVNIAAHTAENAAQHNWFHLVVLAARAAMFVMSALEVYQATQDIIEKYEQFKAHEGNEEQQRAILIQLAKMLGEELVYELTVGKLENAATDKVLARITEYAKDKGYDKKITDVLSDMHQSETNGTPFPHSDRVNVSRNPNLDNLPPGYEVLPDGRIRGTGGAIAKDSGYKTTEGDVIFQRETGSYYYIKGDGTQQSVGSPRDTGDYLKYDNVWASGVRPVDRGRQIQAELAKTEYQQWGNTDFYEIVDPVTGQSKKVVAQNFPLIDFELDGMVVSLKTVNTNGTSWLTDMDYHMRDLANRGIWSDGVLVPTSNRILDIRVQPGGLADTSKLGAMAAKHGITIEISEYGS